MADGKPVDVKLDDEVAALKKLLMKPLPMPGDPPSFFTEINPATGEPLTNLFPEDTKYYDLRCLTEYTNDPATEAARNAWANMMFTAITESAAWKKLLKTKA